MQELLQAQAELAKLSLPVSSDPEFVPDSCPQPCLLADCRQMHAGGAAS